MAFTRVEPVAVHVRTDWFSGRPREVTWGTERLPITQLAVIREEAAAYPVITGPRPGRNAASNARPSDRSLNRCAAQSARIAEAGTPQTLSL